ncbi:thioredoxin domain-containing protein [Candidatus Saccharibacteria bacterium]|nr:thioredoxin domain-containing protein [Candidatus Saccharibacteria bacterium]
MSNFLKKNWKILVVILLVVAAFIGLIIYKAKNPKAEDNTDPLAYEVDLSKYDLLSVIPANEENGNIADHIKGDSDAPVTIFEYADFQCSGCALMAPYVDQLLSEYEGKLRIIYRNYPIPSLHPNAIAAISAAEAAGLQGYWEEYGSMLFANQSEWFYSTGTARTTLFMDYFRSLTGGKGDVAKFRSDMASEAVKTKMKFDHAIATNAYKLDSTPTFIGEDGQVIEWYYKEKQTMSETYEFFKDYVDKQLAAKGID